MRAVDPLPQSRAEFRFYEELNDFLAPALRKRAFVYAFDGTPSVKDAIEAIGVPHTEVDLVLVDGESVDFTRRLAGDERVAVYPVFECLDISPVTRLRARPLRRLRFVLDARLGKLARSLRMLGFDTCYLPLGAEGEQEVAGLEDAALAEPLGQAGPFRDDKPQADVALGAGGVGVLEVDESVLGIEALLQRHAGAGR